MTREQSIERRLVPYVLTTERNISELQLDIDLEHDIEVLCVEDDDNEEFCRLVNRSNHEAFGGRQGMGMPLWVMLDCGILPSAVVGFMLPRREAPDEVLDLLEVDDDYEGMVPVSEYCGCPTVEQRAVSGFSLHSNLEGQGIATMTKALAMVVYGADTQVGVTQFYSPAIRVHVRFGTMELVNHRPAVHTYPEDSFVYRLDLPETDKMVNMARGEDVFGHSDVPDGVRWDFDPDEEMMHGRLSRHLKDGGRVWLTPPGWQPTEEGCVVHFVME